MQLLISNEQQEAAVGEDLCSLIENALKDVLALEEVSGCPSGGRARKCEVGIEEGIGGADANKNLASHLPPLTSQIEVSLALVDDVRMAALNQQYRGIADTTDVLSFPMIEYRSQESVVRSQECKEGIGEARLPGGHLPTRIRRPIWRCCWGTSSSRSPGRSTRLLLTAILLRQRWSSWRCTGCCTCWAMMMRPMAAPPG